MGAHIIIEESGTMPKEKALVVDDDSAIRYTLTEALRGWGYEPSEASTVAAALESFDAERPSAVLQDVNLPDGSGLDALLEYKKHQPQAIVIMITGNVLPNPRLGVAGHFARSASLSPEED